MAANASGPGGGPRELPEEVLADLLAAPRRRLLLERIAESDGATVSDLADAIAAAETDREGATAGDERYREVRDDIFDRHLPKLTATAVVEYDSMRGTVELAAPWIRPHIDDSSC